MEIGQRAPDFELRDQHGQRVRLSALRGQKAVVLMFYPFAFSPVCSGELTAVRDRPGFGTDGVQVLGISCDPMFTLRTLADRDGLSFPLLSDFWPHGEVAQAYGAFDAERGCPRRSTFIVDTGGVLRWSVHNPVSQARDLAQQVEVLEMLAS